MKTNIYNTERKLKFNDLPTVMYYYTVSKHTKTV